MTGRPAAARTRPPARLRPRRLALRLSRRSSSTSPSRSCPTGLAAGDAGVVATSAGDGVDSCAGRGRRRPAGAHPRPRRRLPRPHAHRDHHLPAAGRRSGWPRASRRVRVVGRGRLRARPSGTGSSGSATSRSSTRPSPTGRCGGCASSTPSACPSPSSTRRCGRTRTSWTAEGRIVTPRSPTPADYLRSLPVPAEPLETTPPRLLGARHRRLHRPAPRRRRRAGRRRRAPRPRSRTSCSPSTR